MSAIAEAPGAYLIEARSAEKTAKTGRYRIRVEELRAATAEDKYRVAAEAAFREAEQLQNGTPEEKERASKSIMKRWSSYRRASDRSGEAQTLTSIGAVYRLLGEMRKALEKHNEALPIFQAVGDPRGRLKHSTASAWSIGHWESRRRRWRSSMRRCRSTRR